MINTEKGGQTGGVALVLHNLVTRSEQFKHKLNLKVKEIRHPQPQAASCSLSPRPRLPLLFQAFADPKNTFSFPTLWLPLDMLSFLEFSLGLCRLVNSHLSFKTQLKHNTCRKALVALPGGMWPPTQNTVPESVLVPLLSLA